MKKHLVHIYDVHYKKLLVLSFIVLFLCIATLGITYARTGEFFQKGVSLKGGITMTIPFAEKVDIAALERSLSDAYPSSEFSVREITEAGKPSAIIIEAADITQDQLISALPPLGIPVTKGHYSIETMGSSLGEGFFQQTIKAVIFAFIAMALVVFITFRSVYRGSFILLAVTSDLISTLAVVNLLGIKLSTAGIAAFLMLIGYAVDSDILLTTIVFKRKGEGGSVFERTLTATRTGVFMTTTSLVASIIGFVFSQSDTIKQIMLVIMIGLVFDMFYTWFQNAGILRIYMEKHGDKK